MRKTAGWAVFVLGTTGLGWWGQTHQAHTIEEAVTQAARSVALGSTHAVSTAVSGRDITVSGLADTQAEFDTITAALDAVPGRRRVIADLQILPQADPYRLEMIKTADSTTGAGVVPDAIQAATIAALVPGAQVTLASGAPQGWTDAAAAAAAALSTMIEGQAQLDGSTLSITGRVQTPTDMAEADAALATAPRSFTIDKSITLIDDGLPADFALAYSASTGAAFHGRLNDQLAGADLGARLGVFQIDDHASPDIAPPAIGAQDADQTTALIEAIAPQMAHIERFDLDVSGTRPQSDGIDATLEIATRPGVDAGAIAGQIGEALPPELAPRVAIAATPIGRIDTDLSERTHQVTGVTEYMIDGRWVGDQSPYGLNATKDAAGLTLHDGMIPSAAARVEIASAIGAQADRLEPAYGAPQGWSAASVAGLNALQALDDGTLSLSDQVLTLTGTAATPSVEAQALDALNALPQGYEATHDITVLDDGLPADYVISFDADAGMRIDGRLPKGLDANHMAAALGVAQLSDNSAADTSDGAEADVAYGTEVLGAIAPWLPQIETMQIDVTGSADDTAARAQANLALTPGSDLELLSPAITESLPEGLSLDLSISQSAPIDAPDGTTRINAATGDEERLSAGYWVLARNFDANLDSCAQESAAVLGDFQIGFVSGSDRLDGEGARSVNALAGVMLPCIQAGFVAEVAGHTDSTGSAELNQTLSQGRADAVRSALIARGVPADAMTAQGYGPSAPIASNDTEEGRAANRRTEITWSQLETSATQTGN